MVTVKDNWYNASEIEKMRFCKDVHDSIYAMAYKYKLVYGDNDVYVHFYDKTSIELADQGLAEYKILH